MTGSILTNTSAMIALQTLKDTNSNLQGLNNQISTGKKVASAKDNAAVFAISEVMKSDVTGFKAVSDSLALGSSTLAVASNGAKSIGELLNDIKGKVISANEENVDRATLQDEIVQLRDQISGIVGAAQFNGLNLLKNEEPISVLASLDRDGSGKVETRDITVNGRDFTSASGAAGTGASGKNASLSGTGVTAGESVIEFTSNAGFVTDAGAPGDFYRLTVDSVNIDVNAADIQAEGIIAAGADATDEDVAEYLARAINGSLTAGSNLGFQGVTASVRANAGTPANAELVITSTASEAISIADDDTTATGATAAPTSASLAPVTGETNVRASTGIDLVNANGATGETFDVTVGSNDFTYTVGATPPANTAAAAQEIVTAFNQQITDEGIEGLTFEVDATTNTQINVVNLNSSEGFDISFDSSDLTTNPGSVVQNAPSVGAATAGATDIEISGNIVEGDSFTVSLGSTTATYVAGKSENANDVIRGLQNVIAADGPAGVTTELTFASDPDTDVAKLSIASETGETVGVTEARGGSEATGDLYGLSKLDVTTADGAEKALGTIENLIQVTVDAQAELGASESRIELQEGFLSSLTDSFTAGIGSLVDADLEEASARLQALQVQQQLGTQALSIANQQPQNLLALFR